MKRNIYFITAYLMLVTFFSACKKQDDYLNVKRNNADVLPVTLDDFQAVLDNTSDYANASISMNTNYPIIGLLCTDNYFLQTTVWLSRPAPENTGYVWASDLYQGLTCTDWNSAYTRIEYANIVLDGIANISVTSANQTEYNNIKGSALFYRAFDFYNVAGLFCKPYIAASAKQDLGIPIRLTSDINAPTIRATVQQTYDQIISDLKAAIPLLPATGLNDTRPTSVSAEALMAKVYLVMQDYNNAYSYADMCLKANSTLMDFNNTALVNLTSKIPFPTTLALNPEILYYAKGTSYLNIIPVKSKGFVDTVLYNSYDSNDLRKAAFYLASGSYYVFKGTYDEFGLAIFCGIATNEMYLIRAEAGVRLGMSTALTDINTLLSKRYKAGTFSPLNPVSNAQLLRTILAERRKELPFTGELRWEDLRRLNQDPNFAVTLVRSINGTTYTLAPNDPKYVFPIANDEIQLSGIQQNPR